MEINNNARHELILLKTAWADRSEGRLSKVISVIKDRGSSHETELRRYGITGSGLRIDTTVMCFNGMLSGRPVASGGRGEGH